MVGEDTNKLAAYLAAVVAQAGHAAGRRDAVVQRRR